MGFFSRKPSQTEQARFIAVSQKILPLFIRLSQKGCVEFSDGRTVDLTVSDQRERVLSAVQSILTELRLNILPPQTTQAILDRIGLISGLINATTYEQIGPIGETAQRIVEALCVHDMLCFSYYEQYPSFEPLRELIENYVKIIVNALDPVFDEGLPEFIRLAFPKFAEHFVKMRGFSV